MCMIDFFFKRFLGLFKKKKKLVLTFLFIFFIPKFLEKSRKHLKKKKKTIITVLIL